MASSPTMAPTKIEGGFEGSTGAVMMTSIAVAVIGCLLLAYYFMYKRGHIYRTVLVEAPPKGNIEITDAETGKT